MKTLKISLLFGLMSLSFLPYAFGCGWSEDEEVVRLALFKAETQGFYSLRPFLYCANHLNNIISDPENLDQQKNCQEWQEKVGKKVLLSDINNVLYNTAPEKFELAYQKNTLAETFEGNTLIQTLVQNENKPLLAYLAFAKMMEYAHTGNLSPSWERWDDEMGKENTGYQNDFERKFEQKQKEISQISDEFLQMRYAFLILREFYQREEYATSLKWYNQYFEKTPSTSIISKWALFFKAFDLDKTDHKAEANYYYSLAFDQCYDKKFVAYTYANKEDNIVQNSLSFAKNKTERSNILCFSIINTSSPQLKMLEKIADLSPQSAYLAFLVGREINKLEDWIFTPTFTEYAPSVVLEDGDYAKWDTYHKNAKEKNYLKDIAYLNKLKAFLKTIYPKTEGEMQDFYAMAIAHLCFISDNMVEGKQFLAKISPNASASILAQKNIDLTLLTLKEKDLSENATQNELVRYLAEMEKNAEKYYEGHKQLYSLLRFVADEYKKKGEVGIAGFLFLKSESQKFEYEAFSYEYLGSRNFQDIYDRNGYYLRPENLDEKVSDNYQLIGYWDRYAQVKDLNKVIEILQKKEKARTAFEKFLCNQELPTVNFCKDLKGTIAFRNNEWELAQHTFQQIPDSFWQKVYAYKDYLNEDPFVPKAWQYTSGYTRKFTYKFNKADFLAELIRLRKEATENPKQAAANYIKIGHALYNCSFWGNSWMMIMYGQSSNSPYFRDPNDDLFGGNMEQRETTQGGNYVKCSLAKQYYKSALAAALNDEQKAMANLMIHVCDYHAHLGAESASWAFSDKAYPKFNAGKPLKDFYKKYQATQVFQQFNCPLLDEFVN